MDNQAKIYQMLNDTRDAVRVSYNDMLISIREDGGSDELVEMWENERDTVVAELTKRIEAHPLHQK